MSSLDGVNSTTNLRRWLAAALAGALLLCGSLLPRAAQALDKVTYYHQDALGSTVAATNEAGVVTWRERYLSYGTRVRREDGGSNTLWYTGKPEESDFGLQYFGARWYDGQLGAFLATDPVSFTDQNPISFNRYAYANDNPFRYVDPDGAYSITAQLQNIQGAWEYRYFIKLNTSMGEKAASEAGPALARLALKRIGQAGDIIGISTRIGSHLGPEPVGPKSSNWSDEVRFDKQLEATLPERNATTSNKNYTEQQLRDGLTEFRNSLKGQERAAWDSLYSRPGEMLRKARENYDNTAIGQMHKKKGDS